MRELRQTFRRLAATPGFTVVVVLTLGLGIGANTAIFSAVHRLLLDPLPFQDGDRLAFVWRQAVNSPMMVTPEPEVASAWLDAGEAIDGVGLWRSGESTLVYGEEPVRLGAYRITPDLPALLGVRPIAGRTFTADEARERVPVALISEGLWRGRFGGGREVLGRSIQLDDELFTVIGVMPDRFSSFDGRDGDDEIWTPLAPEHLTGMAGHVGALVRVREGATLEQASDELHRLAARAGHEDGDWRYRAVPPGEFLGDQTRAGLLVLLGAATVVLLIACANIAALLLVRLSGRRRDLAVRTALGAPRSRLIGSLATELLVLATLGCGAGLLLALWSLDAIRALRPPQVEGLDALTLGGPVLLYAGAVALATTLLFGLAPALHLLRRDVRSPFQAAMGSGDRVSEGSRARATLVTAQIALSVALLVGATLLIRTVDNLRGADLGFEPRGLLAVDVVLPEERYPRDAIPAFVDQVNEALAAIPGVTAVTDAMAAPPDLGITHGILHIEGRDVPADQTASIIPAGFVGPGFVHLIGARLLAGRDLQDQDLGTGAVLVDETFAAQHWPDGPAEALGKRFRMSDTGDWNTVVGVVATMANHGPGRSPRGAIYYVNGRKWEHQGFLLRVSGQDPTAIAPAVRAALAAIDPLLPVDSIETVRQQLASTIATQRFIMVLLTTFAAVAVLLSAIGLYGLVAFALARRTREIGIRLALGAAPGDVRSLLLRQGLLLTGAGIILGVATASAAATLLDTLLHGVQPRDPLSFAAAATLIGITAMVASWLPARRATRIDPVLTLNAQ